MSKDLKLSLTVTCPSCGNLISVTTAADGQTAVCKCKNQTPQPPLGGANPATVSNGSVVGTTRMTKAAKRLAALQDAGFSTDGYAALNIKGIDAIVRTTDGGNIEVVADDDPIFAKIKVQGYTYSPRMFKQWVMAQLLNAAWKDEVFNINNNVWRKWLRERRFATTDDVLKLLCDKQLEIAAAKRNGDATIKDDERWYNKQMYVDYLRLTYMKALRNLLEKYTEQHKCKGRLYVRVPDIDRINKKWTKNYKGTFLCDLEHYVYKPLDIIIDAIEGCGEDYHLYELLCEFRKRAVIIYHKYSRVITRYSSDGKHKSNYRQLFHIDITGKAFENAFTGYGVFFTMQNMIRFHGCNIKGCADAIESEAKLNEWAKANEGSAWWLWGALKEFIEHNSFDFRAAQNQWRNK